MKYIGMFSIAIILAVSLWGVVSPDSSPAQEQKEYQMINLDSLRVVDRDSWEYNLGHYTYDITPVCGGEAVIWNQRTGKITPYAVPGQYFDPTHIGYLKLNAHQTYTIYTDKLLDTNDVMVINHR